MPTTQELTACLPACLPACLDVHAWQTAADAAAGSAECQASSWGQRRRLSPPSSPYHSTPPYLQDLLNLGVREASMATMLETKLLVLRPDPARVRATVGRGVRRT